MKNLITLIFFVLIQGFSFSQTITFDKEFNFSISKIEQIPDGDYLISGNGLEGNVIARLDESGFIKWIKIFENTLMKSSSLLTLSDGFFVSTNILESNNINSDACLVKMDYEGNILFEKTYGTPFTDEFGYQTIEADAGNYFFLTDTFLYKINPLGDIKNACHLNDVNFSSLMRNPLIKISEDQYIIISYNYAVSLNKDCDTLWNYELPRGIYNYPVFVKSSDNNILMFVNNKLYKLTLSGEVLFEKVLNINNVVLGNAVKKNDKIYLLWSNRPTSTISSLIILESDSIITSEKIIPIRAYQLLSSYDNGFLFSGYKNGSYRLLKTDSSIYHKSVTLKSPILSINNSNYRGSIFPKIFGLQNYTLTWEASDVENINIDYSSDEGKTWANIANNLSCDSSTYPPVGWDSLRYPKYEWTAPGIFSDEFYLRVSDNNSPVVYDRTDPASSIFIYQDVDTIATNNITMWTNNFGTGSHDPKTDASGFFWPINIYPRVSAIFTDGLVWGGKINGEIRVNGSTYRYGLQAGRILEDGTPDNPISTQSKIFKLRKDWETLPDGTEKQRLEYDYNNWPVEAGAPWNDVNEDGFYTPGFDKPKFIGDEILFYVANDLDTLRSLFTYGSNPIGLEFQTTIFGFNREDLKDVVFKKYKVINKSNSNITDMYFTYWADVDMGDANDDLAAFDSTYNMSYIYNYDNVDGNSYYGYGTPPPAVAHMIVQGPIIPAASSDSARFDDGWRAGYKNLGMTSSGFIVKSGLVYPNDPRFGVYAGSLEFYYLMQGLNNDGSYIINPLTNESTIWPLTGNPVTGTGWFTIYPNMNYGFDQRYHLPTGPFNLAAGDTQEIVIAIPIAKGTDNINSITKLRELAGHVQEFYNTELIEILNTKQTVAPTGYTLYQNYPNPFNPKTTIEYEVPEKSFVTIKVYDILGREVQTLVNNEEQVRYKYKVVFDASTLASGIYFYRLQAGNFIKTRKMILLK